MNNSSEFYKVAGAVLPALLLIVGLKVIIDTRLAGQHRVETAGYKLPEPAPEAPASGAAAPDGAAPAAPGGAGAPAAAAFDPNAVVSQIAAANVENGEGVFKRCAACHTAAKDAKSTVGPNLWGVVGRPIAAREDYAAKYSKPLKDKGGEWSYADLVAFIHNPMGTVPGTGMKFAGIKDPGELADLMAYLRTQADSPAPLP